MNRLVASFKNGKSDEVRVQISELKGRDLVDIRVYTALKDGEEKIATGKGLALSVSDLLELKKAVLETEAVLREHQLIHE